MKDYIHIKPFWCRDKREVLEKSGVQAPEPQKYYSTPQKKQQNKEEKTNQVCARKTDLNSLKYIFEHYFNKVLL